MHDFMENDLRDLQPQTRIRVEAMSTLMQTVLTYPRRACHPWTVNNVLHDLMLRWFRKVVCTFM